MSPSTRSNDTMSGISSLAPSKHSSSSHSLASVSFILHTVSFTFCFSYMPHFSHFTVLFIYLPQMRVPSSPNQSSANPSTPWEAEPVVEESGTVEDANAENLYLMGWCLVFTLMLDFIIM